MLTGPIQVKIKVSDTQPIQDLLDLIRNMAWDERIPEEVRAEMMEKVANIAGQMAKA